jgi:hypothetical protein
VPFASFSHRELLEPKSFELVIARRQLWRRWSKRLVVNFKCPEAQARQHAQADHGNAMNESPHPDDADA